MNQQNIDNLLIKGNPIADSPAIKAAVDAAAQAAEPETVQPDPVIEEKVDYNDRESVATFIEAHPEQSRDALNRYERHVAGRVGSEKEQLTRLQAKIEEMQAALSKEPESEDGDDLGLKSENYKALDQVNQRLEGNKQLQARIHQLEQKELLKDRQSISDALKAQYGEIFTPARERHLALALKTAGNNFSDPDFISEMVDLGNDLKKEAAAAKKPDTDEKRRRVESAAEIPAPSPKGTPAPVDIIDPRTKTVTPKTLKAWADKQISTRAEFKHLRR